mgnify:CR=1 FL=1
MSGSPSDAASASMRVYAEVEVNEDAEVAEGVTNTCSARARG